MSEQVQSTDFIGRTLHRYQEIQSTNLIAKQMIANSEPVHGSVILADFQTKGRGQMTNVWESAAGQNLLTSIILKPKDCKIEQQFLYNLMTSVAIAKTVEHFGCEDVTIKWPNDILVNRRKICGVLIENFIKQLNISHFVIGIGLNVNQIHFPENLNRVTSLKMETGLDFSILDVASTLFQYLEEQVYRFQRKEFGEIRRQYFSKLFQYQEEHTYALPNGEQFVGEIVGVNEIGQLQVRIGHQLKSFSNKEIIFLR